MATSVNLPHKGGLYTPPPTPPESGGLQKAKIAENDHVTHGPTFLARVHGLRGLWRTQPRLNMEKLPAPLATIYIYTCLTPKPNPNTNLNPNPNPNSNPRQWFGCWSPAESGGFHRTPASKVVQKEVLCNFDVESTGVRRSMWGSVKYCT